MLITPRLLLIACLALAPLRLHAQAPSLINYQGRVAVASVNFEGTGQFRFALVSANGSTVYWSSSADTAPADGVPDSSVALPVSKGLYSVLLGDTSAPNMAAIPATVWANADVRLRVWFDDGTHGVQLLTPDQRLAPTGYVASGAISPDALAAGAVTTGKIAAGAVTGAQIANNTITGANIAAGAIGSAQIATNAVDATRLAAAVTSSLWQGSGGNVYRPNGTIGIGTNNPLLADGYPAGWNGVHSVSTGPGIDLVEGTTDSRLHLRALQNTVKVTQDFIIDNGSNTVNFTWLGANLTARLNVLSIDAQGAITMPGAITVGNVATFNAGVTMNSNLSIPGPSSQLSLNSISNASASATLKARPGDGSLIYGMDGAGVEVFNVHTNGDTNTKRNFVAGGSSIVLGDSTVGGNLIVSGPGAQFNVNGGFGNVTTTIKARPGDDYVFDLLAPGDANTSLLSVSAAGTVNLNGHTGIGGSAFGNCSLTVRTLAASEILATFNGLDGNPFVQIGAPGYALYVNSDGGKVIRKDGSAYWDVPSDLRLKHAVLPVTGALETLEQIHPKRYHYNADYLTTSLHGAKDIEHFGVVAQEYQKVFPDFVTKGADGMLSVRLDPLPIITVAAVQQLAAKVDERNARIDALEKENRTLEARLQALEERENAAAQLTRPSHLK